MLSPEQNRLLTEVEGDAPMGRMMRERHWVPCARSEGIEAGGPPKAIRLLGQTYVAFRAADGRLGFFDEGCPHRRVSLALANTEDCALRCIFHGWKFDVSGELLEIPGEEEPPSAAFVQRASLKRHPTFEGGGLVWVYLGQGDPPPRPPLPFLDLPKDNVWVTRSVTPCNWLQGVEATIDSIHVGVLHQSWMKAYKERGQPIGNALQSHPRYEVEDAEWGVKAAAVRHLPDGRQYVRVTQYVLPFVSLIPGSSSNRMGSMFISVPIDNTSHLHFFGLWNEDAPCAGDAARLSTNPRDPENYVVLRSDQPSWGQDREAMKNGHFTGFTEALLEEDMVVQASMGAIVDRSQEHLRATDVGGFERTPQAAGGVGGVRTARDPPAQRRGRAAARYHRRRRLRLARTRLSPACCGA